MNNFMTIALGRISIGLGRANKRQFVLSICVFAHIQVIYIVIVPIQQWHEL